MIALVMIEQWDEVPSVRSTASPRSSSGGGFVDDSLASWGCEWEPIPDVWAPNCFASQYAGVALGSSHLIESSIDV